VVGSRKQRWAWIGLAAALVSCGLALSNPGPQEFEDFAAERLLALVDQELCHKPALPLMLQMVIPNCSAMVQAQKLTLGRLAREHSRRFNLGLASVYSTEFGGQQLLPNWRLPRYGVTTLGLAGHFVVLQTSTTP